MTTATEDGERAETLVQLCRMRLASRIEATTLAALVFVAMPLKHLFGLAQATAILGPLHGIAFIFYAWMSIQAHYAVIWLRQEMVRMIVSAFIPLAGFFNEWALRRRQAALDRGHARNLTVHRP